MVLYLGENQCVLELPSFDVDNSFVWIRLWHVSQHWSVNGQKSLAVRMVRFASPFGRRHF